MRIDIDHIRRQYAALSEEALLEMKRDDLTEVARTCYDEELRSRGLSPDSAVRKPRARPVDTAGISSGAESAQEAPPQATDSESEPDWIEDAAEVYSQYIHRHGSEPAEQAATARDTLIAAGIPAYLEMCEDPPDAAHAEPVRRWRVLVPGNLNLQATSVLECEIFNRDFEVQWRAHLGALSDDELQQASPEIAFGGLMDKLERATRAYDEELARRGMTAG